MICTFCNTSYSDDLQTCPSCGVGKHDTFDAPVSTGTPTPQTIGASSKTTGATYTFDKYLPAGTQLHGKKYTVAKVLGEGGFGITYKGTDTRLRRDVAIKELFPENATRHSNQHVHVAPKQQAGFKRDLKGVQQEAQRIARLNSRSIVDVYDVFPENSTAYIVMEYLEGETLLDHITKTGTLSTDKVLEIARKLCDALAEVHDNQLLHRDISPNNIMLNQDGRIVLIDFGSAREVQPGIANHTLILKEDYAAPEQHNNQIPLGHYTDIYCLGATLFHALTGNPPAQAVDRYLKKEHTVNISSLKMHGQLGHAIQAALELDSAKRPQSIAQFKDMLPSQAASPAPVKKPTPAKTPTPIKKSTPAKTPTPVKKSTPAKTPTPVHSTQSASPYVFLGVKCYSALDLAKALLQDWDKALHELPKADLQSWGKAGQEFQRSLDVILHEPLYALPNNSPWGIDPDLFRSQIAVWERRLLHMAATLDSRWIPTYRKTRIEGLDSLKKWIDDARTDNVSAALLEQCILHGILLAHPKKEVQDFHKQVVEEYRRCLEHCTKAGGSKYDFKWQKILAYQSGLAESDGAVLKAKQNRDAMRLEWFRTLAFLADSSSGCRLALDTLLPLASEEGRRKRKDQLVWGSILFGIPLAVGILVNLLLISGL